MQKSIASSPLVPLITAAGAAVLIFGTFSNGDIGGGSDPSSLAASSTSCDPTFDPTCTSSGGDSAAGAPAPAPAPGTGGATDTTAATSGAASTTAKPYTLVVGKAAKVGKSTVTVTKASKAAATVTIDKKAYTLNAGKPATVGKSTYTYKSVKGKNVTIEVS
jgi:hypothetical protein